MTTQQLAYAVVTTASVYLMLMRRCGVKVAAVSATVTLDVAEGK